MFYSRGQYGSTVYDPMRSDERLEINFCDTCLVRLRRRVAHVHYVNDPTNYYTWEEWDPGLPEE